MPRGIYKRKTKVETRRAIEDLKSDPAPPAEQPKRKYARRQPAGCGARIDQDDNGCVFSVDSTGALLIRRGEHGMELSCEEVRALQSFMERAAKMWAG